MAGESLLFLLRSWAYRSRTSLLKRSFQSNIWICGLKIGYETICEHIPVPCSLERRRSVKWVKVDSSLFGLWEKWAHHIWLFVTLLLVICKEILQTKEVGSTLTQGNFFEMFASFHHLKMHCILNWSLGSFNIQNFYKWIIHRRHCE